MPSETIPPKTVPEEFIRESIFDTVTGPPLEPLSCDDSATIKNWFLHFCNTENPDTPNIEYDFWFFLRRNKCHMIRLRSVKWISDPFQELPAQTTESRQMPDSGSDFDYHPISQNDYIGLKRKNVFEKIESELQSLAQTIEVVNSPLFNKVKTLTIAFNKRPLIKLK